MLKNLLKKLIIVINLNKQAIYILYQAILMASDHLKNALKCLSI